MLLALEDHGQAGMWAGSGSVWGAGMVGSPEQIRHNAGVQLQDGAHTEQVHDLV